MSSADAGPEKRSDRTKTAILQPARERLAVHGYDRMTIRAVAADAGIHPSMVMRYFGSKPQLFDAAMASTYACPIGAPFPPMRSRGCSSGCSSIVGSATPPTTPC